MLLGIHAGFFLVMGIFLLLFPPTYMDRLGPSPQGPQVVLMNLMLGWSVVFWIWALVIALGSSNPVRSDVAQHDPRTGPGSPAVG